MSFEDCIEAENKRLEQEAEKFRQENDLPGFWIPEKGENNFEMLPEEPREKDFGQGIRKIFAVKVGEEKKDWALNPKNPVYREIIKKLAVGQRKFCVLRTGEGKATRYEILEKDLGPSV